MVKKLFLLRHAKSDHPSGVEDHERPITARGKADAKSIGKYISEKFEAPDIALCSTAERTRQTLQAVEHSLKREVTVTYSKPLYLATPGEILKEVSKLDDNVNSVLVVGHNPGIHQLSVLLTGKAEDEANLAIMRLKFPTSSLAVFTCLVDNWGEIEPGFCTLERFITPKGA